MSPKTVSTIIRIAFALLGCSFLMVAVLAFAAPDFRAIPTVWMAALGIGVFVVLVVTGAIAPRASAAIAFDEGFAHAWLRAQAFGYWTGVVLFAVFGNLASAGLVDLQRAFLDSAMLMAASPFVRFFVADWTGR